MATPSSGPAWTTLVITPFPLYVVAWDTPNRWHWLWLEEERPVHVIVGYASSPGGRHPRAT